MQSFSRVPLGPLGSALHWHVHLCTLRFKSRLIRNRERARQTCCLAKLFSISIHPLLEGGSGNSDMPSRRVANSELIMNVLPSTAIDDRDHVMPRRVMIVDDHPAIREGLAATLESNHRYLICGQAESVSQALDLVDAVRPDLVVIDIVLRQSNGIDLVKQIKQRWPDVRMLVWSMHDDGLYAARAMRAGAAGYLNKQHATRQVLDVLDRIARGDSVFPEKLGASGGSDADGDILAKLSDRELEVFRLIGNGMTTAEIAEQLQVSVKTIETHRQRIKVKLRYRNSVELGRRAVQFVLENQ